MNRRKLSDYRLSLTKQHESKLQELRQERLIEEQRLDGLKKVLIMKMNLYPTQNRGVQTS